MFANDYYPKRLSAGCRPADDGKRALEQAGNLPLTGSSAYAMSAFAPRGAAKLLNEGVLPSRLCGSQDVPWRHVRFTFPYSGSPHRHYMACNENSALLATRSFHLAIANLTPTFIVLRKYAQDSTRSIYCNPPARSTSPPAVTPGFTALAGKHQATLTPFLFDDSQSMIARLCCSPPPRNVWLMNPAL